MDEAKNIFGQPLLSCNMHPMTGFYRDGCCHTDALDQGTHTVCAVMTEKFLAFTKSQGNDLSTALPHYQFPGLKPGDKWCLCVTRWKEALQAGVAPKVIPEATHEKSLEYVSMDDLIAYSYREN